MDPASLGAARQYQFARQALRPDSLKGAQGAASTKETTPSPLARGIKEFSQVFENVETTSQAMSMGTGDPHSVVEALATAEVALEAAVTIRNRVVEAYQELLRMPV